MVIFWHFMMFCKLEGLLKEAIGDSFLQSKRLRDFWAFLNSMFGLEINALQVRTYPDPEIHPFLFPQLA